MNLINSISKKYFSIFNIAKIVWLFYYSKALQMLTGNLPKQLAPVFSNHIKFQVKSLALAIFNQQS